MARRRWVSLPVVTALTVITALAVGAAGREGVAGAAGPSPIPSNDITTSSCADAHASLAASRSRRIAAAKAATELEYVDLSTLVPRTAPSPEWGTEYLGGSPGDVSSLPAGAVSEARTSLVPNGLEEGYVRGFNLGTPHTRVFYAVYRFATTVGATNVVDAVIKAACDRKTDLLSTGTWIVGASSADGSSNDGNGIDLVLVRDRLLFDFYADGDELTLDGVRQWALDFFAQADASGRARADAATIARATTSRACTRIAFLVNVPTGYSATMGEFRAAVRSSLAAVEKESADPDARRVATALRRFDKSLRRRSSRYYLSDEADEKAAVLDNACRRLTGSGAFRS